MFQPNSAKTMIDLHGLSVKEAKQKIDENFARAETLNLGEIYIITGRGNHANADGSRGILKKILPKLLEPYCQSIVQTNVEIGAYKIILKPKQARSGLKDFLSQLVDDEDCQIQVASILKDKANKKDIESMIALALIYVHKAIKGFEDIDKGIALLEEARALGSLEAEVQLGLLYHEGVIVKQKHEKAYRYFLHAAKKQHALAEYYVALCYLHGKGVKYKDELAVEWMKKSADQNYAPAQDALSDFYLMGDIAPQQLKLGIIYKTKAAEQGITSAQIDLARCYATGHGVDESSRTAFKWYLEAAQANDIYALYQVGSYLASGRSGYPPNPIAALPWYLKSAEFGDGDGQAEVAYQYLFGIRGFKEILGQDLAQGMKWALKAVAQKNRHGYYVMAKAYLEGAGVGQSLTQAYQYMTLSAEAGYVQAQYELGLLMIDRNTYPELPHDFTAGKQWLEKAAANEHEEARQMLSEITRNSSSTSSTSTSTSTSTYMKLLRLGIFASVSASATRKAPVLATAASSQSTSVPGSTTQSQRTSVTTTETHSQRGSVSSTATVTENPLTASTATVFHSVPAPAPVLTPRSDSALVFAMVPDTTTLPEVPVDDDGELNYWCNML